MLVSMRLLEEYTITATDGEVGQVCDSLFDDQAHNKVWGTGTVRFSAPMFAADARTVVESALTTNVHQGSLHVTFRFPNPPHIFPVPLCQARPSTLAGRGAGNFSRDDHTTAYGVASGSESGFDWSYGIGAELVISPQWSAVLQYNEHFLKFAGDSSDRVTATTIGVRMRF